MWHRSGGEVAFPVAMKPCPSSTKEVTLLVGRSLESACRYSGHYSAQGKDCKVARIAFPGSYQGQHSGTGSSSGKRMQRSCVVDSHERKGSEEEE